MRSSDGSSPNRRTVLRGIAGGVGGFVVAARRTRRPRGRRRHSHARGARAHAAQRRRRQYRSCSRRTAGKVVVDSGAAAFGEAVLATLDELPGGRVTTLFNTHWHLDQVGSNEAFGSAGATIIAHEKTRLRLTNGYYVPDRGSLRETAARSRAADARRFYTDDTTTVGGRRIEYGYLHRSAHRRRHLCGVPGRERHRGRRRRVAAARPRARLVRRRLARRARRCAGAAARASAIANTRFVPSYGPCSAARRPGRARPDARAVRAHGRARAARRELARTFSTPACSTASGARSRIRAKFLYDVHKGFWAHHNKLMPDIV